METQNINNTPTLTAKELLERSRMNHNVLTPIQSVADLMNDPDIDRVPVPLWDEVWYRGEVGCLFADTNVGKSIYAVQMAYEISKTQPVLYFDFEMSDETFVQRYHDADTNETFLFTPNFYRGKIDRLAQYEGKLGEALLESIYQQMLATESKVLFIDNILKLDNRLESGDAAAELMENLLALSHELHWSILVLGHTNKRDIGEPLTQNSLAGSKRLANFFDIMICMDQCVHTPRLRFLKQVKNRKGAYTYDATNVMVMEIVKTKGYTHFELIGTDSESNCLRKRPAPGSRSDLELADKIASLSAEGLTQRAIAEKLNISQPRVCRMLKLTVACPDDCAN